MLSATDDRVMCCTLEALHAGLDEEIVGADCADSW